MRRADIVVGQSYKAANTYPLYGARVKVLEVGVERRAGRATRMDGVRVLVERFGADKYFSANPGDERFTTARNIEAPWTEAHDQAIIEREARTAKIEALKERVRNVPGATAYGARLIIDLEHADEFLDRAGIPR